MRSADAATLIRVVIALAAAWLVLLKYNPWVIALMIGLAMLLDAVDGYFAVSEASGGKVGIIDYIGYALGSKKKAFKVNSYRAKVKATAKFGARMDIAGDRIMEYAFWIVFTYLGLLPLGVLFLIMIRHSFVDALMGEKGTSSKMNTSFASVVYSSKIGRLITPVLKFLAFAYLAFVYVSGYPIMVGYALVGLLLFFILLRGAAEAYEAFAG